MNEAYIDKINRKLYECFETKVIRKMKSDGYINEFRNMILTEDGDDVFMEIRDIIEEWYFDLYDECALDICNKNARGIIKAIQEDKTVYDNLIYTIKLNNGYIPDDEGELAFNLLDYGFITLEGYDGWMDYATYDVASKIYDMVR